MNRNRAVHPDRLVRWLGSEATENVSRLMHGWPGPPIALAGVPGAVWVGRDGDFCGDLRAGYEASARDRIEDIARRLRRGWRRATDPRRVQLNTGIASVNELILAATTGGGRWYHYQKVGTTGVVAVTNSLWRVGNQPAAAGAPAAAPGGTVPTDATQGAFPFTNPNTGDTQHFVTGFPLASVSGNTLLLYDRIFEVNKTMNSTGTEAVTGVPTRYQSITTTADDYIGGNFLFVETQTALPATAHNWTVCTYLDQANAASTLPSLTGNASAIINRLDHPTSQWFAPLATGDTGVKALTQMQCSALVATGAIAFVIGHPIAWMPCAIANLVCIADGVISAVQFTRIFDDAALALLEVSKPATTATTYTGSWLTVAS